MYLIFYFIFYSLLLNFSLVFFNVLSLVCLKDTEIQYIPNPECSEALTKFNYRYVLIFSYLRVYYDLVVVVLFYMCVCVCVCMYIYIYIYICVCVCVCVYIYLFRAV